MGCGAGSAGGCDAANGEYVGVCDTTCGACGKGAGADGVGVANGDGGIAPICCAGGAEGVVAGQETPGCG